MVVRHPIDAIPAGRLRFWQVPSLLVAAVFIGVLPIVLPSRVDDTLVDLVEAGTASKATAVLAHWSASERVRAAYAVGFDFLMNPAYMNALAIAAVWAGRTFEGRRAVVLASWLAWLAWSVVFTNVIENIGLFIALSDGPVEPWPLLVAAAHYWAGLVVAAVLILVAIGALNRVRSSG